MSGSGFEGAAQVLLYLLLLFAILAGGQFFLRNSVGFLQQKKKGARKLEISETRMLGNRQFLVVAQYEGKKMLIGVCPGRIDYLCELGEGDLEEDPFPEITPEKPE